MRRALLAIDDAELRQHVAADAKRPRLDLVASLAYEGLDDSAAGSFASVAEDDQLTAQLGLSYEQPLGGRAGHALERQAGLRARQALARYEDALRNVVLEVKQALRDVQTSRELLEAAHATRLAETENLRTILLEETSRKELTPEFLAIKLGRQERLATAQLAEVGALASFHRALAAYRRAVGLSARPAEPAKGGEAGRPARPGRAGTGG